jgi:hypothetical protein
VKYWEIIADNLRQSGLELGRVSAIGFQGADHLDCRRTSRRRKAFRCACE